jgi:ribosomal protein S1
VITKIMREEKNCERKYEFKETMSMMAITKLEGGDLVMMEGVKAHL